MAQAGDVVAAKYRLIHPLGIGGMGTVWRCEHIQLKLQMAIKLLDARGPAAERAVQRFTREARIAASVRHRNVVSITDFGTDGGAPYLVMELLHGVPLSERLIVAEPLTVGVFLRVIDQVLHGLRAVHDKGVIHRDLKPENIFLVREEGASVKLLDFGVSRSVERDKGHTLTRDGIVMGTPEYIAPEQARGKMPDVRSDIYSVGVVMYEALAGVAPFHADNAADVIVAVLNGTPVPLESIRSDLDLKVPALVAKAMAKKPEDRFQSAEEMRQAVLGLLRELPELERAQLPKRFVSHAPPPERVALFTDPPGDLAEDVERPTISRPATRASGRAKWKMLGAAALVVLGIAILVLTSERSREAALASAKPAPSEARSGVLSRVKVEVFGVPDNGQVLVDGEPIVGTKVQLARGSGEHTIEVRAPGLKPWGVQYDASKDGRFEFVAEPDVPSEQLAVPQAVEQALTAPGTVDAAKTKQPEAGSRAARTPKRGTDDRDRNQIAPEKPESEGSKLLRTPDF